MNRAVAEGCGLILHPIRRAMLMSRYPTNFDVKYLMGHPLIGEPTDLTMTINRHGISLIQYAPTLWAQSTERAQITWDAVDKISVETQGEVRKRVSAGRTAVGLVLFGPPSGNAAGDARAQWVNGTAPKRT